MLNILFLIYALTVHSTAPKCGSFLTKDGDELLLSGPSINPNEISCNNEAGNWFAKSYYAPSYAYGFQLTQRCEYQFQTPEGNDTWQTVWDVNSWFEQAAKTFQRPDNKGYKVDDDDDTVIFTGTSVPDWTVDLIEDGIENCPEDYCVKIVGPSVGRKGSKANDETAELLYAFSHQDAHADFAKMVQDSMKSSNSRHIFMTNHFLRCGCGSFCYDDDEDEGSPVQATCYVEELCGQRTFQIGYAENYPENMKAPWASTGTAQVMEWFDACADAVFGCQLDYDYSDMDSFKGSPDSENFPTVYEDNEFGFGYGLGGGSQQGFPYATSSPSLKWNCPSQDQRAELRKFGTHVEAKRFMRNAGLDEVVPEVPCKPETFDPPEVSNLPPPVGPPCTEIDHAGYCMQLPGGTCYIREPIENCIEVDFVVQTETSIDSIRVFSDVREWMDDCISIGTDCTLREDLSKGVLTNNGAPSTSSHFFNYGGLGWYLYIQDSLKNGKHTLEEGDICYDCQTWDDVYAAKNVSKAKPFLFSSIIRFMFVLFLYF